MVIGQRQRGMARSPSVRAVTQNGTGGERVEDFVQRVVIGLDPWQCAKSRPPPGARGTPASMQKHGAARVGHGGVGLKSVRGRHGSTVPAEAAMVSRRALPDGSRSAAITFLVDESRASYLPCGHGPA